MESVQVIKHPIIRRSYRPMIRLDTRLISKHKFSQVIRCLAVGTAKEMPIIAVGSQDKYLYLLNENLKELQKIKFDKWVRCVALGDLLGDGCDELVVGGGDKSLHIYKFLDSDGKFHELYSYEFDHFVNTCEIADITGDGELEIIVGSWDQTIHALKLFPERLSILWVRKLEKRVNIIKVADINKDGKNEILVLFKEGSLGVFSFDICKPLWLFKTNKELLTVDVGPLDEKGINYIVTGGNGKVLYIIDPNGNLIHKEEFKDRITALILGDIDGDENNDMILGEGDIALKAFKFSGKSPAFFEMKWNYRIHHTLNCLLLNDFNKDQKRELIFGGYNKTITAIQDTEYGMVEPIYKKNFLSENESIKADESENEPNQIK